ncbi:hypothetical protein CONCODRAFT_6719 [Conidiobolus coronatus NRRL 28638]|uniref:Uncharacterized protein n=1 Tax=Conidiobolus coronatus (strain ATCC 28846 / CBS 209.66 / NRRL 28638) TaxID=796925 RepID=A0A137P6S7_CONC2|nr:hypothetical protein CONCODRAFT_6719 [Conidiobolus coronatus NRRL 28638]|eukprot:KXN70717.1 hypothetical protein CONCODRAFT_6719 [Conidiobolus coronatus NRRL 28638]
MYEEQNKYEGAGFASLLTKGYKNIAATVFLILWHTIEYLNIASTIIVIISHLEFPTIVKEVAQQEKSLTLK